MIIREMGIEDIGPVAEIEAKDSGNPWDQTGLFTYLIRDDSIMLVADECDSYEEEFVSEDLDFDEISSDAAEVESDQEDTDECDPGEEDAGWRDSIIGFTGMLMMPPEADILDIVVDHEHRGLGIGTKLFGELLARAKEKGVTTVYLEVRVSNTPARKLYEKYGFVETGMRKNYYSNPTEDAITMRLDS